MNLSESLPLLFRRAGGEAIEALLAAIDEEWRRKVSQLSRLSGDEAGWLGQMAEWYGWGALLADVGGIEYVSKPTRLSELPSVRQFGTGKRIRFWVDCLFALEVIDLDVQRSASPDLPGCVTIRLAGTNDNQSETVYRVIKRLIPAHLTFYPSALVIDSITPATTLDARDE